MNGASIATTTTLSTTPPRNARFSRGASSSSGTPRTPQSSKPADRPINAPAATNAVVTGPEAGEHPEEWHERLCRVTVDEGPLGQSCRNGEHSDDEPHAVTDVNPAEDVEQQGGNRELDHERERGEVANRAEDDELERAGLQHRVGEGVRPVGREELFAAVDEVNEVAGIRPSIEVRPARSEAEHGYPHAGERRTQQVPHLGRYRPLEG